jgi:hypothetical protein
MSNVVWQPVALFKCSVSYEKYRLYRCFHHDGDIPQMLRNYMPSRSGSVQRPPDELRGWLRRCIAKYATAQPPESAPLGLIGGALVRSGWQGQCAQRIRRTIGRSAERSDLSYCIKQKKICILTLYIFFIMCYISI